MKKTIRRTLLVRILAIILAAFVASGNVTPAYAALAFVWDSPKRTGARECICT